MKSDSYNKTKEMH